MQKYIFLGVHMKFCPYCGAENKDDYRFCEGCGRERVKIPSQQPMPQPQYQPSPPPEPLVQQAPTARFPSPLTTRLSRLQIIFISGIIVGLILTLIGAASASSPWFLLTFIGLLIIFLTILLYADTKRVTRCQTQPEYALTIAGWSLIIVFILGIINGVVFSSVPWFGVCGIVGIIFSVIALLGGIFALRKENFEIALIGGIFGCLSIGLLFGLFVSIYAIMLIVMYRNQFIKKAYYRAAPTAAAPIPQPPPPPQIQPQPLTPEVKPPPAPVISGAEKRYEERVSEPAPMVGVAEIRKEKPTEPITPPSWKCQKCGFLLDADSDFCPNCGTTVRYKKW